MTRGIADVFQIIMFAASTHAFLAAGGARVGAFIKAEKHVFKLIHARVGKQQGWVAVRHQWARSHDLMAFARKKIEKRLADLVAAWCFA